MSDLQALEKHMLIEEVEMGGTTVTGEQITSLELPTKGFPAWRLEYNSYDGPAVLVVAHAPIIIRGRKLVPVVEEEIIEEEE